MSGNAAGENGPFSAQALRARWLKARLVKSRRPGRFPGLRGALVFAVFMILAPAAFAQSAKTMLEDPALATRFNEVSDRLVCQCGCQMILRVCNHVNCPSAVPMRQSIEKQLLAGSTDDAIVQGFVDEYGMKVLSSPPATGFNLAAYVMPGFVLLIGLFIAGYVASRWSAKRKLVTASAAPVDVDPDMQKRIDDEIRMDKS